MRLLEYPLQGLQVYPIAAAVRDGVTREGVVRRCLNENAPVAIAYSIVYEGAVARTLDQPYANTVIQVCSVVYQGVVRTHQQNASTIRSVTIRVYDVVN